MFILLRNPTTTSVRPIFERHLLPSKHTITSNISGDGTADLGNRDSVQQAVVQRVIIPCSLVFGQARWTYVLKREFSMKIYCSRKLAQLYCTV